MTCSNSFRPWSYSRVNTLKTCKQRFYLNYVLGNRGFPNEAMKRGKEKHSLFESLIKAGANKSEKMLADNDEDRVAWNKVKKLAWGTEAEVTIMLDDEGQVVMDKERAFTLAIIDSVAGGGFIDWKMGASGKYDELQRDFYAMSYRATLDKSRIFWSSFIFPYMNIDTDHLLSFTKTHGEKGDADGLFGEMKGKIIRAEEYLKTLDVNDWTEWQPSFSACSSCTVFMLCKFQVRRIEWVSKTSEK